MTGTTPALTMAGRRPHCDDLTGPDVAALRERGSTARIGRRDAHRRQHHSRDGESRPRWPIAAWDAHKGIGYRDGGTSRAV